jgi:hypothetical protein
MSRYDSVDWLRSRYGYDGYSKDSVDELREGAHQLAIICPECEEQWLMGRESQDAGMCWNCRQGQAS